MGTILDRSIDVPRDISFRGNFTLRDKSGAARSTLSQDDLSKLVSINDGQAQSNRALVINSDKSITGVNEQTNSGKMTFDKLKDSEEGAIDMVFKRAKGNILNKKETIHGNHVGVLSFQPYVGNTYIDSAGIDINTYKKSYQSKYSGSEIIFSNSGGSDINSGKHDSLKIDAMGNLNVLKYKELRFNGFKNNNFSGFRPSISTSSPGYTLELPPTNGSVNDVLRISKVGSGGSLTLTSNGEGVITNAAITSSGQDYDPNYLPEINTEVNITGGLLKENGIVSSVTTGIESGFSTIILSEISNTSNNYYTGWSIETINPNSHKIIRSYIGSSKTATLSSNISESTTTNTQYKLKQGHGSGSLNIITVSIDDGDDDPTNNQQVTTIYLQNLFTTLSPLSSTLSSVDNYYNDWTIVLDINSVIYTGIVNSYLSSNNSITVDWNGGSPPDVTGAVYSLTNNTIVPASIKIDSLNSIGGIHSVSILDGGSGYIPNKSDIVVNISSQNRLEWVSSSATATYTPPTTVLTTGPGLTGGGSIPSSSDVNIELDLSTLDVNGDTSNYSVSVDDRIPIYKTGTGTGNKLPSLTNFLSSIAGTGLTSDTSGLTINNSQSFLNINSTYLKLYASTNNHSSYFINIGKDDNDNLKISPQYDNSDNLKSIYINTNTSDANINPNIEYHIGSKTNVMDIHGSGVSVKRGFLKSVTITNSGSGYTRNPQVTVSESPFGSSYTAQITCIVSDPTNIVNDVTQGSGEITSIVIVNPGLGYSNLNPPVLTIEALGETNAGSLEAVINQDYEIVGQVGNDDVRYDGYFHNLNISGDQDFEGALNIVGEGAVNLGKPSNLDFTENDNNFIFGYQAGNGGIKTITGVDGEYDGVTYTGYRAGYKSTRNVAANTFYGLNAGYETFGVTGDGGKYNTYVGANSGYYNVNGYNNTSLGYYSGYYLSSGINNTCLGANAGYCTSTTGNGSDNVFIGYNAITQGGDNNVYIGSNSGYNASSDDGVFLGHESGYNSTGNGNILIGKQSGKSITTSSYNVCFGYQAGYNIVGNDNTISTGYTGNVLLGYRAGYNMDQNSSRNIILGPNAGPPSDETDNEHHNKIYIDTIGGDTNPLIFGDQSDINSPTLSFNAEVSIRKGIELLGPESDNSTSGYTGTPYKWYIRIPRGYTSSSNGQYYLDRNIQIGTTNYGLHNYSGTNSSLGNVIMGIQIGSGTGVSYGMSNVLIGERVSENKSNLGSFNVGIGNSALANIDGGDENICFGYKSGYEIIGGNKNVYLGTSSGYYTRQGNENVGIGYKTATGWAHGSNNNTGSRNTYLGSYAGTSFGNGQNNVAIGYNAGPSGLSTNNNRLYIDVGYYSQISGSWDAATISNAAKGGNSLIYGDQSSSTSSTLSFNADVTISNENSDGNLEVQGGEISFWGKSKSYNGGGSSWKIFSPGSTSGNDTNLVISNDPYGLESPSSYNDTIVIGNLATGRGSRSTIIGSNAGRGTSASQDNNTFIGYNSGSHGNVSVAKNTFIGAYSGKGHSKSECICIGYNTGHSSTSNRHRSIIIDAMGGPVGPRGSDSLIYASQYENPHTLSLNADVTIKNGTYSSGNLNVEGSLTTGTLVAALTATSLVIQDYNIDINPSTGRTNFGYNFFLTNNSHNLSFSNLTGNTFVGTSSSSFDLTGDYNTMFGHQNLINLTTGGRNTVFGTENAVFLTTGTYNTFLGHYNLRNGNANSDYCVAVGYSNFISSTGSPDFNVALGYQNCKYLSGEQNVAIGTQCLGGTSSVHSVDYSVCIGYKCGEQITGDYNYLIGRECGKTISGTANVGIGLYPLQNLTTGSNNIAIGYNTCIGSESGTNSSSHNIGLGFNALFSVSSGSDNVSIGRDSGKTISSGSQNVFINYNSGFSTTTGTNNVFIGTNSGYGNLTGGYNIALGVDSGKLLRTGHRNICLGYLAGPTAYSSTSDKLYIDNASNGSSSFVYGDMGPTRRLTINGSMRVTSSLTVSGSLSVSGSFSSDLTGALTVPSNKNLNLTNISQINLSGSVTSMYLGYYSGISIKNNTSAFGNTYFGYMSGRYSNNSANDYNTLIGYQSGYNTTSAGTCTMIGGRAGYSNQTGHRNVCLGFYSGYYVKGSYNLCLGQQAGPTSSSTGAYRFYLDPVSRRGSDSFMYGYAYGTTSRILYINSRLRIKSGYDAYATRWSTYSDISLKKDILSINENVTDKLNLLNPVTYKLKSNDKKDVGFIAQEIKKIFPLLVQRDNSDILTLAYSRLTPYIVKGLQETNKEVQSLQKQLEEEKQKREKMEEFFIEELKKLREEISKK